MQLLKKTRESPQHFAGFFFVLEILPGVLTLKIFKPRMIIKSSALRHLQCVEAPAICFLLEDALTMCASANRLEHPAQIGVGSVVLKQFLADGKLINVPKVFALLLLIEIQLSGLRDLQVSRQHKPALYVTDSNLVYSISELGAAMIKTNEQASRQAMLLGSCSSRALNRLLSSLGSSSTCVLKSSQRNFSSPCPRKFQNRWQITYILLRANLLARAIVAMKQSTVLITVQKLQARSYSTEVASHHWYLQCLQERAAPRRTSLEARKRRRKRRVSLSVASSRFNPHAAFSYLAAESV